ncbi:RNA polymerase sigma factor region1.1 domain-containing protein [Rahnella perminowiae]
MVREQGYLTYAEVNDHLPEDIVDSDQIRRHHPDD